MLEYEGSKSTCEQKRKKWASRSSSSYYDSSSNSKRKNARIEDEESSHKKEEIKDDSIVEYTKHRKLIVETLFGDLEDIRTLSLEPTKQKEEKEEEKNENEDINLTHSIETHRLEKALEFRGARRRVDLSGIVTDRERKTTTTTTTTTKKKPKTRTKRSRRATSKTIIHLPREALSLVVGFERDLPLLGVGIREREWLNHVLKTTRNQILYEELSCAMQMITKNVLKCIFGVTSNNECLYLMDQQRVEKKKSKEEGVRKKAMERTKSMSVSKIKDDRNEGKKYVKFKAKSEIARDYNLINVTEIERILGFFFFSSKSKTIKYKTVLESDRDSSPPSKSACNSTILPNIAVACAFFGENADSERYEDIHYVFEEWSKTHNGVISFVIRSTERLLSFCQRVKKANVRGYHSNCETCSSKVPELYPTTDNVQRNSPESSFRSRFATFDDSESVIFSIVLKETLNFYFSDRNRLRFSKARHPLSDPSRRRRLSNPKSEDPKDFKSANYARHALVDEKEEEEEEEEEGEDRERSIFANFEEEEKSNDLLRQTSAPSLLCQSHAKKIKEEPISIVDKPHDIEDFDNRYVYENTNEICRFFIYGDKRSLMERLKTPPDTTKRKGLFTSNSSKEQFYACVKEKKRTITINTNNLFAIFRMHPVHLWKTLAASEAMTDIFTDEIVLKEVISRIVKMYLILLWEVD